MNIAALIPVEDTPVTIGVMQFPEGVRIPVYMIEFPATMQSFGHVAGRYSRMNLDIIPSDGGYTFHVTSSVIITELTPEKLERAFRGAPEDIRNVLYSDGMPEFASSYETTVDAHRAFIEAYHECGGHWLLVVLTEDSTELLVGPDAVVVRVNKRERNEYTQESAQK